MRTNTNRVIKSEKLERREISKKTLIRIIYTYQRLALNPTSLALGTRKSVSTKLGRALGFAQFLR